MDKYFKPLLLAFVAVLCVAVVVASVFAANYYRQQSGILNLETEANKKRVEALTSSISVQEDACNLSDDAKTGYAYLSLTVADNKKAGGTISSLITQAGGEIKNLYTYSNYSWEEVPPAYEIRASISTDRAAALMADLRKSFPGNMLRTESSSDQSASELRATCDSYLRNIKKAEAQEKLYLAQLQESGDREKILGVIGDIRNEASTFQFTLKDFLTRLNKTDITIIINQTSN